MPVVFIVIVIPLLTPIGQEAFVRSVILLLTAIIFFVVFKKVGESFGAGGGSSGQGIFFGIFNTWLSAWWSDWFAKQREPFQYIDISLQDQHDIPRWVRIEGKRIEGYIRVGDVLEVEGKYSRGKILFLSGRNQTFGGAEIIVEKR